VAYLFWFFNRIGGDVVNEDEVDKLPKAKAAS
jgi:hypothetical protein